MKATSQGNLSRHVFSFGALMAPSCLTKRAITPIDSSVARLADDETKRISFSHRAAYATLISERSERSEKSEKSERSEKSEKSERSEKGQRVDATLTRAQPFGVIHELSADDFAKVCQREIGYRISKVTVECLDCDPPQRITVDAFTSAWGMELRDGALPPTARYKRLLLEGLEHHGIRRYEGGARYVDWVHELPTVDSVGSDPRYGKTCAGVDPSGRGGRALLGDSVPRRITTNRTKTRLGGSRGLYLRVRDRVNE